MSNYFSKSKNKSVYIVGVIILLAAAFLAYGQYQQKPQSDPRLAGLAKCIKDSGASFYGTFWCSHCQNQKEMFGAEASDLPYVECSTADGRGQLQVCADKEITGYPTWIFSDGTRASGSLSAEDLAARTGCQLAE